MNELIKKSEQPDIIEENGFHKKIICKKINQIKPSSINECDT